MLLGIFARILLTTGRRPRRVITTTTTTTNHHQHHQQHNHQLKSKHNVGQRQNKPQATTTQDKQQQRPRTATTGIYNAVARGAFCQVSEGHNLTGGVRAQLRRQPQCGQVPGGCHRRNCAKPRSWASLVAFPLQAVTLLLKVFSFSCRLFGGP